MEFELSKDLMLLKKSVRDFALQEIAPRVPEMEKNHQTPMDIVGKMGRLGFLGVTVPGEYGGAGMGSLARMLLIEELARVSAAMAMTVQCAHFGIASVIGGGSKTVIEKYLPPLIGGDTICAVGVTESSGGSDPAANTTEALDKGDHFILNGRKAFISNSHVSQSAVILAKTRETPKRDFTAFLVDREMGMKSGRLEKKIGFHGCATGELVLENCRVPRENMLGKEGHGLLLALRGITEYGRTGIAAMAVGLIQASLDAAVRFANERMLYGKNITALQSVQFKIADIYADLHACRLLAYRAAWIIDSGGKADVDVAAAKFYCSEAALRCTRRAMDIMGAYGCMEEFTVERCCRDAQLLIPADGTNDIMRVVAGRGASAAGPNP